MITQFNRGNLIEGEPVGSVLQADLEDIPSLTRASLSNSALYGGRFVREALNRLTLGGDHQYVTVDIKNHFLMKGMIPAIPGWHTDGVPRSMTGAPRGTLYPDMRRQEGLKSPVFHLMYAGAKSPTQFIRTRNLKVDCLNNSPNLYASVDKDLSDRDLDIFDLPEAIWYQWDWWELHRAVPCQDKGYRVLIRVTESDYVQPENDLNKMIRRQQNVYIQGSYGW